jgi:RNase_H superfamily
MACRSGRLRVGRGDYKLDFADGDPKLTRNTIVTPIQDTLVFDYGTSIIGIYSVRQRKYRPYYGEARIKAAQRLVRADCIVSFNGEGYDLPELSKFLGEYPKPQQHIDMMVICWNEGFFGRGLRDIYRQRFGGLPEFPDTYEGDNRRDVHMTLRLWRYWKRGTLVRVAS